MNSNIVAKTQGPRLQSNKDMNAWDQEQPLISTFLDMFSPK